MFLRTLLRKNVGNKILPSLHNKCFSTEVSFKYGRPFKLFKLDEGPPSEATSTKEEMLDFYRQMVFYRRFEITCDTLYKQRLIRGFCHLYDGQEAVVIGMEASLQPGDSVITSYREHCQQLSRGDSAENVFGELFGKKIGCSKGRGGSMHLYYPENNFYGGNGIVGAQVPLAAGLAFAHKYREDGGIAVGMYGDGAANQGQVFEAANMAALWKLPMIFVCENNEYGMGTATGRHAACEDFYTRGHYIPGVWADGMDVLASREGFKFCADWARSGKGPIFLEMSTYRYHGHSMSDPGISYRTRDEVDVMRRERDPIDSLKRRILENEWSTGKELKAIDKAVRKEINEAVKIAKAADSLLVDELWDDVYAGTERPPFIKAVDPANNYYAE